MGLYTFTYMAIGVLTPLISQYLKSIGFSGAEIGTVTAAGTCTAIFASAFWGKIYTIMERRHLLVMLLCLMAAAVSMIISHVDVFPVFLILFAVMYFFQAPVMSLSDALAMSDGQPFGFVRMFGAAGFAAGVFIAARISDAAGLEWIFPMYCISYVIAAAVIFSISRTRQKPKAADKAKKNGGYIRLLADKKYIKLVICAFFMCGTNVANNTYFGFLYIEGGGALAGVGIAFLLMAGSEAPIMAWTKWLSEKLTSEKLILIAMIVSVLRFAWYATEPPYYLLLALFALQGIVNGIILVEFVRYISALVSRELNGMAIAAFYSFSSSGSTILCQLAGGFLLDKTGAGGVYLFFSLFNLTGLILYMIFGLYKRE
ncbi:MAG: MFS transporter [Eubacteriaceae bacterium]|nr:MFS transporter [Eubacteriaceae bacterium]